jgi:5-methylcytosine-specific restriction endonuclease McrA
MPYRDVRAKNDYERGRYHKRRAEAISMLGGKCAECEATDDLQFDHVNPEAKSFPVGAMWSVSRARYLAELTKCQLLCRSCHKRKTAHEQRVEEHGTWAMWRHHKCRCQICRDFFNEYRRSLRRRKTHGAFV